MASYSVILLLRSCIVVSCFVFFPFAASTEFEVGGKDGWIVPKSKKDGDMYNDWASQHRFKVNDTVRFKYDKDSVLVVTKDGYKKCRSSQPEFFSNNGDTVIQLNRSGLFYFISGVTGHCQKGQKIIIKVLDAETPESPSSNNNNNGTALPDTSPKKNAAVMRMPGFGYATGLVFIVSLFGFVWF